MGTAPPTPSRHPTVTGQLQAFRVGAAGLRTAGVPLFVEHYLDAGVEAVISDNLAVDEPQRTAVAEVGNLAASRPGAAREIFVAIAATARAGNLDWLVCNATDHVKALLRHMRLPFTRICRADPARVPDRAAWGRYYDRPSQVMVGPVAGIIETLTRDEPLRLARALAWAQGDPCLTPARHRARPEAGPQPRPQRVVAAPEIPELYHDPA